MKGSFSEEALLKYAEMASQTQPSDFAEGDSYDFTTCIRPDGSAYGTSGKCRKGTEGVAKVKAKGAAPKSQVDLVTPRKQGQADVDRLKKYGAEEKQKLQNLEDSLKKNPSLANDPATQARKKVLERNVAAADSQLKGSGGRGSRGPVDRDARVAKHQEKYDAAKAAHDASKAALAAHKGRDARSRALKQPLQSKHEANIEKLGAARDRLINAKVAANAAKEKAPKK